MLKGILRHLFNPPPSNLIFYTLIISNCVLLTMVEYQGHVIHVQRVALDYYYSLLVVSFR